MQGKQNSSVTASTVAPSYGSSLGKKNAIREVLMSLIRIMYAVVTKRRNVERIELGALAEAEAHDLPVCGHSGATGAGAEDVKNEGCHYC